MNKVKGKDVMLSKYLLRSDSTAYRTIDGIALIVGAPEGKLRSLNEAGTFIWEKANGRHTLSEIVHQMCQKYDVDYTQAAQDAEIFVHELESEDMLVLIDDPVDSEEAQ